MNVSEKTIENLSVEITLKIEKADYQEKVDKSVRSYRQKANIPGFRKGMAPLSMIKKMVGRSILVEEINKIVSEELYKAVSEKKMAILGEPLPAESQATIDFETQEDFEFVFEAALVPAINVELSEADSIEYSDIEIDDEMIAKQVEAYCNRFGKQEEGDIVADKDIVKGKFTELNEDGSVKEGGIVVEAGMVSPNYVKSEADKAAFIGAKVGDKVVFNAAAACAGNDTELASMLHIEKEAAADVKSNFEVEIASVLAFKPAEVNQELFDNAFGQGEVKDEAEFKQRIKDALAEQIAPEADYKFTLDAKAYLDAKIGEIVFADTILKRWLKLNDKEGKIVSVDEEYQKMLPDLKWQLIKERIVRDNEIKVEQADVLELAKKATKMQFAQYGMMNAPEDMLQKYAEDMLKDSKIANNLAERVIEEKIVAVIKGKVTLNKKSIKLEEFYKLLEAK